MVPPIPVALVLLVLTSSGALEPATLRESAARQLYVQGYALWQRGDKHEACTKLERSNQLHESIGSRLNVARCQHWQGLTAHARASFTKAATMARAAGQQERAAIAERLAAEMAAAIEGQGPTGQTGACSITGGPGSGGSDSALLALLAATSLLGLGRLVVGVKRVVRALWSRRRSWSGSGRG